MNTKQIGSLAEEKASKYLQNMGFKLIEKNYNTKLGEIDLIMIKENVYHFIEVKSGIGFDPVYNITPNKLAKIIKTVYSYIKKHRLTNAFCIDALIIRNTSIEYLPNITL